MTLTTNTQHFTEIAISIPYIAMKYDYKKKEEKEEKNKIFETAQVSQAIHCENHNFIRLISN